MSASSVLSSPAATAINSRALASRMVTSSSDGGGVTDWTVVFGVGFAAGRVFFGQDWPAGFAMTTVLILLSLSVNALFLGIVGEYVGRIYRQVRQRPLTIIEARIDASAARPPQD